MGRALHRLIALLSVVIVLNVSPLALAAGTDCTDPNPLVCTCKVEGSQDSALCKQQQNSGTDQDNPINGTHGVLPKIINLLLIAAGVAAVIVIILGSLQYVISAGDSSKIEQAKNTIIWALIGLVIAVSANIILKFVIGRL